jgi:hypothetical protein
MKFPKLQWSEIKKQEWFIFLSINVFFPWAMSLFILISYNYVFRWVVAIFCIVLILSANIYRIRKGQGLKKWYIAIIILNLLSFLVVSSFSFFSSLDFWVLRIAIFLDVHFGDGILTGWPYETTPLW